MSSANITPASSHPTPAGPGHDPARTAVSAGGDVNIGGDVVGRDKITNIVLGIGDLPSRHDGAVRNFLEYYLGVPGKPAPFGGRQADLERLDAWLNDPAAPRYALLAAPAGRGKSALLAHWATQLEGRAGLHVVYFPLSIRYATNQDGVAFSALAARLAHIHQEKVTEAFDASQYQGMAVDYLRRPPADGGQLLVVLDGLDEAAFTVGADVFPTEPPAHLRVLAAARPLAGDAGPDGWLTRLGWERPGYAQSLPLGGLDLPGVRDVLAQMGNPLEALAAQFDVVARLHTLSDGDPLLVRLYVEALLPQGEQAALITTNDLLNLKPGLKAYLDRWWDEQRRLWGAASPLREPGVKALLAVCATALGPLSQADVLALAPHEIPDAFTLAEAARAVGRLVIGDGDQQGYTFSHPRLRDYFADRLTPPEARAWQQRFWDYGQTLLADLEAGAVKPEAASGYLVRYYGVHLAAAQAAPTQLYALLCEGWLRAWEWAEGTPDGFLNDAGRAWARAEQEGAPALGQAVRAATCLASVATLSANIDDDLLRACLRAGVVSPRLGLVLARRKPSAEKRVESLMVVVECLPQDDQPAVLAEALTVARAIQAEDDRANTLIVVATRLPPDATDLLTEALTAARAIQYEGSRTLAAVAAVAARLLPDAQPAILAEALTAARAIQAQDARTYALAALVVVAARLLLDAQPAVLAEALTAARAIQDAGYRAYALAIVTAMAARLPPDDQPAVLAEALTAVRAIQDEKDRAYILATVAEHLPPDEQPAVLAEALTAARAIQNKRSRTYALATVAEHLPPDEQPVVLAEALTAARAIQDKDRRARALSAVAERLPPVAQPTILAEALRAARAIQAEDDRAAALSVVVARLPPHATDLLAEALTAARAIQDGDARARALSAVAKRLPPVAQPVVLAEALTAARAIQDKDRRARALSAVAERLPPVAQPTILAEALRAARAIQAEDDRAAALSVVVTRLPPHATDLLAEALTAARAIQDEDDRARALRAVAKRLPPDATDLLAEALAAARAIQNEWGRARALAAVAARLSPVVQPAVLAEALVAVATHLLLASRSMVAEALTATRTTRTKKRRAPTADRTTRTEERRAPTADHTTQDEYWRADALAAVAAYLPPVVKPAVLAKALTAARAIQDEDDRARALRAVAKRLPPAEQPAILAEALRAACAIQDEQWRAGALSTVAAQLPPDATSLLAEALQAARAIQDEQWRAYALAAVAKRLAPEAGDLQYQAWQMAIDTLNTKVIRHSAASWPALSRAAGKSEFQMVSDTLRAFAPAGRPQLLKVIEVLLPVIHRLGGDEAVRGTAQAIIDTAKWWP